MDGRLTPRSGRFGAGGKVSLGARLDGTENLASTENRSPDRPDPSESLQWLVYRGPRESRNSPTLPYVLESIWNVMAHGDAREGKWRGNWRMEWVASTLLTTSEHGVSSITTTDA